MPSAPPGFAQARIGKFVLAAATALVSYLLVVSKTGQLFISEVAAVSSQLLILFLRLNQDWQIRIGVFPKDEEVLVYLSAL